MFGAKAESEKAEKQTKETKEAKEIPVSKPKETKAESKSSTVKKYKVIAKAPGVSKGGIIKCNVNGKAYSIKENEPTVLNGAVLSFLRNARIYRHMETGADAEDAVNIAEGFKRTVEPKYEVLEA
jgi:hypothetical protein